MKRPPRPLADLRWLERRLAELIVDHVCHYYGHDKREDGLPWVTDYLRDYARGLKQLRAEIAKRSRAPRIGKS